MTIQLHYKNLILWSSFSTTFIITFETFAISLILSGISSMLRLSILFCFTYYIVSSRANCIPCDVVIMIKYLLLFLILYYRLEVNIITKMVTIDSSTNKTGIGFYKNGTYVTNCLIDISYDKQMDSRFALMSKEILSILDTYNPDIAYIEETVVVRNPQTQRFLTRLQGVIYAWCIQHGCEFNTIRPTEWRKLIGIKQGKNVKRDELKKQSIKYVEENYELKVGDDVADALCIGSAVLKRFEMV